MKRAIVILLAMGLDLAWGDPPNHFHPVTLMGRWLAWGRDLAPARRRFWFGLGWTLAGAFISALPWHLLASRTGGPPGTAPERRQKNPLTPDSLLVAPFLLKPVFAYRNLRRAVLAVHHALATGDLPEARRLAGWHLVSRDTGQLSEAEVAGAAIESLAENLTDSVTAPLMAYAAGGLPAAWAYRFTNTADAMWGYRTAEFEQLGKFPARLDDALNWLPARLTGWLLVAAARLAGEGAGNAARTMLAQHNQTASCNAGWTMSAMAGALGLTLSKRNAYQLRGGPAEPDVASIHRALRVADLCLGLTVVALIIPSLFFQLLRRKL